MHQPVARASASAASRGRSLPVPAVAAIGVGGVPLENGAPGGGREERLDGRERQQESQAEALLPGAAANDAAASRHPPPVAAASVAAVEPAYPADRQPEGRSGTEGAQPPSAEEVGPPPQGSGEGPAPAPPPRPLKLSGGGVKLSRKTKGHAKAASTAFVRVAKSPKPSFPSDGNAENKAEEQAVRRQEGSLASTLMEDLPVKKRKLMREGHESRSGDAEGSKGGGQQGGASNKGQPPSDGAMDDIFASLLQA